MVVSAVDVISPDVGTSSNLVLVAFSLQMVGVVQWVGQQYSSVFGGQNRIHGTAHVGSPRGPVVTVVHPFYL